MTVRISATDWMPNGNTEGDAVEVARAFIAHGAAAIDAVRRPDPTPGRPGRGGARGRGRRDLVVRRRQLDPAGRPPTCAPSAGPTSTTRCGRCTRLPTSRTDKIPPRLSMLRDGDQAPVHVRWRPAPARQRVGASA
ncbi:MAG TPA: hypothetical protein PLZ93_01400 [Nocardioides sp.]|uniref:hypothetical protein n=1 Tax=uncultured Nocardioides sp. TaxID=198441 RepID=UPI002620C3A8|nr:hypothetical protein [uncultured Nocardioides sp.]HRI94249.1 hypothetical protein [Nocardioides sp.]HRK46168.1 hypothetical protein [Nocardioides sp.]